MGEFILELMRNETAKWIYEIVFMGVAILPIIGLAIWYQMRINKTAEGRRLSREYDDGSQSLIGAISTLKNINQGGYGPEVGKIYKVMWRGLRYWFLAIVVVGGVPLLASAILG